MVQATDFETIVDQLANLAAMDAEEQKSFVDDTASVLSEADLQRVAGTDF